MNKNFFIDNKQSNKLIVCKYITIEIDNKRFIDKAYRCTKIS